MCPKQISKKIDFNNEFYHCIQRLKLKSKAFLLNLLILSSFIFLHKLVFIRLTVIYYKRTKNKKYTDASQRQVVDAQAKPVGPQRKETAGNGAEHNQHSDDLLVQRSRVVDPHYKHTKIINLT